MAGPARYISADSILDAIHRSYDAILKAVETNVLSFRVLTAARGATLGLVFP